MARQELARVEKRGAAFIAGGVGLGELLLIALSVLIVRSIVRPLNAAVDLAETIGAGDLSKRMSLQTRDELGRLSRSLDAMAQSLEDKAAAAQAIAKNDLTQEAELASDRDVLGLALQTMTGNLNAMVAQIKQGLSQIDGVTQQNTANAEETAAASQELNKQAVSLLDVLSRFQLKDMAAREDSALVAGEGRAFVKARAAGSGWESAPTHQGRSPELVRPQDVLAWEDEEL